MSSRRRRSGDFTNSVIEYQRQVDGGDTPLKDPVSDKKTMLKVRANETVSPDTTIFEQVSSLRFKVNAQKQDLERDSKTLKTSKNVKNAMSKETSTSPNTEVLNKISKELELKQDEEELKYTVETPKIEPSKLWNALSTFNRSLNSDKNGLQSHQKLLSRLSQEFQLSPTKFAEKLVTIIEESMIPSFSDQKDSSDISVGRMTKEFRKLCKFIEDESMPEWVLSPDVICEQDEGGEQIENQSIELVDDDSNLNDTIVEDFSPSPFGTICIPKNAMNYAETPKGIFGFKDSPLSSGKRLVNKALKNSRFNETNHSFEYWESMCNGVYLNQQGSPQRLRRSISLPNSPATELNKIRFTCEKQLASLDDSAIEQIRKDNARYFHDFTEDSFGCSSPKTLKETTTRTPKSKNYFSEQTWETKMTKQIANRTLKTSPKKRKPVLRQRESPGKYSPNCEDDLDRSLIAELAQRRQRCFETAKLMMEIDKNDPIISDKKEAAELISKLGSPNKSLSLPDNNREFLKTINHCMEYQDFLLKKRKSIFQIIQNPKADTDSGSAVKASSKVKSPIASVALKTPLRSEMKSVEKKATKSFKEIRSEGRTATKFSKEIKSEGSKVTKFCKEIKKEGRKGVKSPKEVESEEKVSKMSPNEIKGEKKIAQSPNKIESKEKKPTKSPRRRFFLTPGQSPKAEEVKKKKEYFPQVTGLINSKSTLSIENTPRTPEIRKNMYENVRSPVAEYIKSTDAKLVKNIIAKTNDWLLTPQPLGIANECNINRMTPLKYMPESLTLKFNLSPMGKKVANSPALGDENIPEKEFRLPKVQYKSPAKVQTIKENLESPGLRVKTLLKSSEKKIVIRHEGRVAVASPRNAGEDQTDNTLLETSIHVKTVARKTDYIRTRNVR